MRTPPWQARQGQLRPGARWPRADRLCLELGRLSFGPGTIALGMNEPESVVLSWRSRQPKAELPGARLTPGSDRTAPVLLVSGDNARALTALGESHQGKASLVYLDPPFFTGRQHLRVVRGRDHLGRPWRESSPAFDDRWASLPEYLDALWPRLVAARKLLSEDGCLVLHVDPKTSHYAKILLDEIFGIRSFASEIVWRYRRWPARTANFQRVHDVLLRYVKNPDIKPRFQQLYEPLAASTRATWGDKKQRAVFDTDGRRRCSSRTQQGSPGAPLGDVWDIGIVAPVARERTGYPTQKPEALLERLVLSCTEPGDLVVDGYAGSGTTLAVCARHQRRAIGIDHSEQALQVIRERLAQQSVEMVEVTVRDLTPAPPAVAPSQKSEPRATKPLARPGRRLARQPVSA